MSSHSVTHTIKCPSPDATLPPTFTVCGIVNSPCMGNSGYILIAFIDQDGSTSYTNNIQPDITGNWCGQISVPTGATGGDLLVYYSQSAFTIPPTAFPGAVVPDLVIVAGVADPCSKITK